MTKSLSSCIPNTDAIFSGESGADILEFFLYEINQRFNVTFAPSGHPPSHGIELPMLLGPPGPFPTIAGWPGSLPEITWPPPQPRHLSAKSHKTYRDVRRIVMSPAIKSHFRVTVN